MKRHPPWPVRLVRWFERYHRSMPWREDPSPYRVLVSEVMLQQTQVVTVIPYFDRFMIRFPTLESLAASDLADVLRVWEGLGYYSRARNLHRTAQIIVERLGNRIPRKAAELEALPGLGPYTAAAVASIAFGEAVPVVDGNVLRVFSRFWGIDRPVRLPSVAGEIRDRLTAAMHGLNPSHFNQAIMETGALICRPRNPMCRECFLADECVALQTARIATLPVVRPLPEVPHYTVAVGVVWKRGRILIARRHESQMLGGLWEFPGGKQRAGEPLARTVEREILEETGMTVRAGDPFATVKHAYSHFRITMTAFHCKWMHGRARPRASAALKWIEPAALHEYPFPRANRRIAQHLAAEP